MKNFWKKFSGYFWFGVVFSLIIFLIQWFTGLRKFGSETPRSSSELILLIMTHPELILEFILFSGFVVGGVFYALFSPKK
jgi:predicted MFS family arabinose efflux permease